MVGVEEFGRREQQQQPVVGHFDHFILELNRLQNQIKEKKRELGAAQSEIKALKATDGAKDRVLEELENEVNKLDEKLRATENSLEQKNLEINKLDAERKHALAAQFASEATLRRVYASQKDTDSIRIESFLAPLEAENKMYKNEIAILQEDKKSLERLTKTKELALLEAEKVLKNALDRALIVEEVQNLNIDLRRQIEICLAENKTLDKTNRKKVVEVEKLSQTVRELEEAILAGGTAANTVRDCQRQISELNEEKRVLERELARARVAANRVAAVAANEWKDETDKVIPVKQWLEERRLLQAEVQRLKEKLAVSERMAKAEAQIKEKLQLRLKTLEDGLKQESSFSCASSKLDKRSQILGFLSSKATPKMRSSSQPRATRSTTPQRPSKCNGASSAGELKRMNSFRKEENSAQTHVMRSLWASKQKSTEDAAKENVEENTGINVSKFHDDNDGIASTSPKLGECGNEDADAKANGKPESESEDMVSGFLYDKLQKEVLSLRKLHETKEFQSNAKDEEIKILMRKVDALTRAIEVGARKVKREIIAKEKLSASSKLEDNSRKRNKDLSKRTARTPLS